MASLLRDLSRVVVALLSASGTMLLIMKAEWYLELHASLDRAAQKQLLGPVFADVAISREGVASYEWNETA